MAGLQAARARGRKGGRPKKPNTDSKIVMAKRLHAHPNNSIAEICKTCGASRATLYRYPVRERDSRLTAGAKYVPADNGQPLEGDGAYVPFPRGINPPPTSTSHKRPRVPRDLQEFNARCTDDLFARGPKQTSITSVVFDLGTGGRGSSCASCGVLHAN